jgi:hypothetical protein
MTRSSSLPAIWGNWVRGGLFCAYFLDYENLESVAQFAGAAGFNYRR